MRHSWCVGFPLLLALGAAGCLSAPKSKPVANNQPKSAQANAPAGNVPFWADQGKRPAPPASIPSPGVPETARPAGNNAERYAGMLAGQLVDGYGQRVMRAYIQVAPADPNHGNPTEVAVNDGFFTIPGLASGRSYLLTARTGSGERKLAGRIQVSPPHPRLVIKMTEDMYSPGTPPAPGHAGDLIPGTRTDLGGPPAPPLPETPVYHRNRDEGGPTPVDPPSSNRGAVPPAPPLLEAPADDALLPPPGGSPFQPENITDRDRGRTRPPVINVPGPPPLPDPDAPPMGNNGRPGNSNRTAERARLASCEFSGRRLDNFVLPDLAGQPWEFRQHHGRLVLLDFWGTWCTPCVRAIPHLKQIQSAYGPYGLEVIGIACERLTEPERTRRVRDVSDKHQINYRILLGEEFDECPVQQKFRIDRYPTLILLDGQGNVIWRGDANGFNQLDAILRQQLRGGR